MKDEQFQKDILQRLNVIIWLLLDAPSAEKQGSVASKVHKLSSFGLTPSEIAAVLGKPVNYITANLAAKRAREER